MAHAAETPAESTILTSEPLLTFNSGGFSYRIERRGEQSMYTVSDGKATLELPIKWVVGAGRIGQTYVIEKDGQYYESRVSYFKEIKGLDISIGHQGVHPKTLMEAVGKPIPGLAVANCFNCHATNALHDGKLTEDTVEAGIRCVRCHEAAPRHLAGLSQGELDLPEMKKLTLMPPADVLGFCGQCHRTASDVTTDASDPNTVRFAPYRLSLSKCYDLADKRITCMACHDPHQEVGVDKVDYDSKCNACHAGAKPGAAKCKVATNDCVSCHMPRVEIPGAHHQFIDHWIRIANPPKKKAHS